MKGIFAIVLLFALLSSAQATEIVGGKPDYQACVADVQTILPLLTAFISTLTAEPFDPQAAISAFFAIVPVAKTLYSDCTGNDFPFF